MSGSPTSSCPCRSPTVAAGRPPLEALPVPSPGPPAGGAAARRAVRDLGPQRPVSARAHSTKSLARLMELEAPRDTLKNEEEQLRTAIAALFDNAGPARALGSEGRGLRSLRTWSRTTWARSCSRSPWTSAAWRTWWPTRTCPRRPAACPGGGDRAVPADGLRAHGSARAGDEHQIGAASRRGDRGRAPARRARDRRAGRRGAPRRVRGARGQPAGRAGRRCRRAHAVPGPVHAAGADARGPCRSPLRRRRESVTAAASPTSTRASSRWACSAGCSRTRSTAASNYVNAQTPSPTSAG